MGLLKQLKRGIILVLCLCLLPAAVGAEEGNQEILEKYFSLRYGDRNVSRIAITVDDCYKSAAQWIGKDVELCEKYGVRMTFFPLVYTGCLEEEYRDLWQSVLDSGCEIGTHSYYHEHIGNYTQWGIVEFLGKCQEQLDRTLGYHYEIRWFRPPYGSIEERKYGRTGATARVTKSIKSYGFDHIVLWDVSETLDMNKALKNIKNGSILLFHTKQKDTEFLEKLIPELQDRGFEMVTVSELFGFDPPETSEELYVFNLADYRK